MKILFNLFKILLILFFLSPYEIFHFHESEYFSTTFTHAQKRNKVKKKYLTLTIGITHDEGISSLSTDIKFLGDWKKNTNVSYSKDLKILRFEPKKSGVSTLTVHHKKTGKLLAEYRIDIKSSSLTKVAREMKSLLGDIEGITIKIVNNRVVVDGQIILANDMKRIYNVVRQYEGLASSLVTLSPIAQKKIASLIEHEINMPEVSVKSINEKFILEGFAESEEERKRAEIIAKTYVPDKIVEAAVADGVVKEVKVDPIINLIKLKPRSAPPPGKIIQLVIHYVELQKDYTKGFRFQWTPSLSDGSGISFRTDNRAPSGVISSITGTISNLLPKLNWAKQHGHARVLQSSSLIVQDGNNGSLKSVSKIPYQVVNKEGQPSTNFAEVGLISSVTPQIIGSRSDSISLKMDFSLSSLISYTDQGPMTSQSTINTVIIVKNSESAAVGGLISNSHGTNYNKLPKNVSPNPLISLYASKDFRRNQSQFVVFITPIIKKAAHIGSDKIKRKFRLRH